MNINFSIVISSCDKFSSLWKTNIFLIKKNWIGPLPKIYIVTDKRTNIKIDDTVILNFSGDMPHRLKKALNTINDKYILFSLDDYFLIKETYLNSIEKSIQFCEQNDVDYLLLYRRKLAKGYKYKSQEKIDRIDLHSSYYAVNLYPALWKKTYFLKSIDDDLTPWQFEPTLTKKAIEFSAKCYFDFSGKFVILDVIRKGKLLHKAKRYLKKYHLEIGSWETQRYTSELFMAIKDFIRWYTPKWFYKFLKKIGKKIGMKFYSGD